MLPFEITDKDMLCRKLLANPDPNLRIQGVRLFFELAQSARRTLVRCAAGLRVVRSDQLEALVDQSIGDMAARLLREIENGRPSFLDDRIASVVAPVLGFCRFNALRMNEHSAREEELKLDNREQLVLEEDFPEENRSDQTGEFAAEFLRGMSLIASDSGIRGHKRGVFAIEAIGVLGNGDFSAEGIILHLVRVGLGDEAPAVVSRLAAAEIKPGDAKLTQKQIAVLFGVDPARVRQWINAVRRWIVKQSPLLQQAIASGELGRGAPFEPIERMQDPAPSVRSKL
jgi:hypothetical protein